MFVVFSSVLQEFFMFTEYLKLIQGLLHNGALIMIPLIYLSYLLL